MSKIVISFKIFPFDVTVDLNLLKRKIEKSLPEDASVYKFAEEPIAFGLTALITHTVIPEKKSSGIETLIIRRV